MHKIEDRVVVELSQQHEDAYEYVREYRVGSICWVRFTTSESVKPTAFVLVNGYPIHVSQHETMAHAKAKLETLTPIVIERVKKADVLIFRWID